MVKNMDGINTEQQERKVLDLTAECWNEFVKLKSTHPDELNDFADGIHKLQYILGMRMVRRDHPDIFPIK
jgi:hypothetical protein